MCFTDRVRVVEELREGRLTSRKNWVTKPKAGQSLQETQADSTRQKVIVKTCHLNGQISTWSSRIGRFTDKNPECDWQGVLLNHSNASLN